MSVLKENIQSIKKSKQAIRQAIINKCGEDPGTKLADYADKINSIDDNEVVWLYEPPTADQLVKRFYGQYKNYSYEDFTPMTNIYYGNFLIKIPEGYTHFTCGHTHTTGGLWACNGVDENNHIIDGQILLNLDRFEFSIPNGKQYLLLGTTQSIQCAGVTHIDVNAGKYSFFYWMKQIPKTEYNNLYAEDQESVQNLIDQEKTTETGLSKRQTENQQALGYSNEWCNHYNHTKIRKYTLNKYSNQIFLDPRTFAGCMRLEEADVPSIGRFRECFTKCENLKKINFPEGYITCKTINTTEMLDHRAIFKGCKSLTDVSFFERFKFEKSTYLYYKYEFLLDHMFNMCENITTIKMPNLKVDSSYNVTKVTLRCFCEKCYRLKTFIFNQFSSTVPVIISNMFNNCQTLQSIDISNIDTLDITEMSNLFFNCRSLQSFDFSKFNFIQPISLTCLVYNCQSLKEFKLLQSIQPIDLSNMCNANYSMETFNVPNMDNSQCSGGSLSGMFYVCYRLQNLTLGPKFFDFKSSATLDLSYSPLLTHDSMITSFYTNQVNRTINFNHIIKLHKDAKAKLSEGELADITNLGFTIA